MDCSFPTVAGLKQMYRKQTMLPGDEIISEISF